MEAYADAFGSSQLIHEGEFKCVFLGVKSEFVEEGLDESDVSDEEVDELDFAYLWTHVDEVFRLDPTRVFLKGCREFPDCHVFFLSHVVYRSFLEKMCPELFEGEFCDAV